MGTFLSAGTVRSTKQILQDALPTKAQRSKVALSMYSDLPDGEIAIEEFERFAMDRLRGKWAGWGRFLCRGMCTLSKMRWGGPAGSLQQLQSPQPCMSRHRSRPRRHPRQPASQHENMAACLPPALLPLHCCSAQGHRRS